MDTKYLVIADTYDYYGSCITVFGIFDTEQKAIDFIIANPTPEVPAECVGLWQEEAMNEKHYFDFFKYINQTTETKEEYAKRFIKVFNGVPLLVAEHRE